MTRKFSVLLFILLPVWASADNAAPVASRFDGSTVYFYASLHEAVAAVPVAHEIAASAATGSGLSAANPDVITLLSDIVLDEPVIIDTAMHVRLVASGSRSVMRGSENPEYPLFWIRGRSASLTLGISGMEGELYIDGGYLHTPAIIAHSPLITLNGPGALLIMHDNVYLQNNYNNSSVPGTGSYQLGAGVFIRTIMEHTADMEHKAEFIMKGGIIRGNINNTQDVFPYGGGVLITYYGIFTMEGGVIMNNTAYRSGGGVQIDSAGSFRKTGGIIYGINADEGYRNTVISRHADPQYFGHAVAVFNYGFYSRFRDDTVGESENLSYIGQTSGIGIFGEGDKWSVNARGDNALGASYRLPLMIWVSSLAALAFLILFIVIKKKDKKIIMAGQNQEAIPEPPNLGLGVKLSPREKEVFDLFLSGYSAREAALRLGLTISSINYHSENMYRKLGIQSRTELLVKYKYRG